MDTPPPLPAPPTGRINLAQPPPGRFLYTVAGDNRQAYEGRLLEQCPDDGGWWLKLQPGDVWVWSGDVFIEVHLPEQTDPMNPMRVPEKAAEAPPPAPETKPEKARKRPAFRFD